MIITCGSKSSSVASLLVQAPGQQDRGGDFVELQAAPIGAAVNPAILREAAIGPLKRRQPDQGAQRRAGLAGGEQRGGALHQVSRPDQMIATQVVVALGLTPGDAHGGDERPLKDLVLMRQQHATAQPVHAAAIGGVPAEVEFGIHDGALPLADIPFAVGLERLGQRLEQLRRGALVTAATGDGDGEFTAVRERDFAGQRDVALLGACGIPSPS